MTTPAPRRRVVVTGMGQISAAGSSVAAFWDTLVSGRSAIRTIRRFDAARYPTQIAAEIDEVPDVEAVGHDGGADVEWRARGRIATYAAFAAARAIEDAGLGASWAARERTGVALAAGLGSYDHEEVVAPCGAARADGDGVDWTRFVETLRRSLKPRAAERRTPGSIATLLAQRYRFGGPVASVMTACSGGAQAIGDAVRWIRLGRADAALAGGADSELYPMGLASFCLLGALSRRNAAPHAASRPFDAGRDGFVLGEGAAMLMLEERDAARRRGARIYAEVAGFGSACDAYRVTDPHPEGYGAVLAMTRALAEASIALADVGYINAHGTSTIANDRTETLAVKKVFGDHAGRLAMSSTKSMIGHATVAAGALEAVATVLTLVHQTMHPTINLEHRDPACDLDYVPNAARSASIDAALSNSFAFGGQAASLLLIRHEA